MYLVLELCRFAVIADVKGGMHEIGLCHFRSAFSEEFRDASGFGWDVNQKPPFDLKSLIKKKVRLILGDCIHWGLYLLYTLCHQSVPGTSVPDAYSFMCTAVQGD